jgi:uncharacterized membrane protein
MFDSNMRLIVDLQGWKRRLVYVLLFESLAITCTSTGLSILARSDLGHAGIMGLTCSAIAVIWTWIFNSLFEQWESRQVIRGRSALRRLAHALGFEGVLLIVFVSLFAWWFSISLWEAFLMDAALFIFFLAFTYLFNWAFDTVFGLPESAV